MPAVAHPVRDHCLAPERAVDAPIAPVGGRYGRAFPDLPALESTRRRCSRSAPSGGLCDGSDATGDDGTAAAGWPFFGQFIAHDITADRSPIGPHADATTIANFRSPRANLECLYGAGPVGAPVPLRRATTRRSCCSADGDVPRNAAGHRPDRRPAQRRPRLHLAAAPRPDRRAQPARRPPARGRRRPGRVLRRGPPRRDVALPVGDRRGLPARLVGPRPRRGGQGPRARATSAPRATPFIPFEFADAAFRYGHGQIRHRYRLQDGGGRVRGLPRPDRAFARWRPSTGSTGGCSSAPRPPAGQAHGRPAGRLAHRPARRHHRRRRRRGLPLARGARPAARRRHRPALRRGGRARDRRRAAHARRGRAGGVRLAGRDAALALRPARGRRARRRRPPRRGRRPPRGRGPGRPARRRPRVLPGAGARLGADAPGRGRALRRARPARRPRRERGRPRRPDALAPRRARQPPPAPPRRAGHRALRRDRACWPGWPRAWTRSARAWTTPTRPGWCWALRSRSPRARATCSCSGRSSASAWRCARVSSSAWRSSASAR